MKSKFQYFFDFFLHKERDNFDFHILLISVFLPPMEHLSVISVENPEIRDFVEQVA